MCCRVVKMIAVLIAGLAICQTTWAEDVKKSKKESGGSRWALLVGVDEYLHCEPLRFAGADMRAMRDRLVATGFPDKQVFLLDDKAEQNKYRPFKPNVERELEQVLGMVERDDLIVVAFSGHGVHLDDKSYLCPTEAQLKDATTLISLEGVYERLQKCPAPLKLLLVDACRNDPRREGEKSLLPNAGTKQFAESLERPPRGILLLTSCAPGQVSMEERDFGHGVFMHFLLEGLGGKAADQDGAVSLMGLFKYSNKQTKLYVHNKFNGYQTPALKGDIQDDFELARVDCRPAAPIPTAPPPLAVAPFDGATARRHQDAWAKHLGKPREMTNSIGMKLVLIPAGEFMMGNSHTAEEEHAAFKGHAMFISTDTFALDDEYPQHRIRVTKPFYLGLHEVTQGEYQKVMAANPSYFSANGGGKDVAAGQDTSRFPVESVSWEDAVEFCRRLSQKEGDTYRLPTEAEWEYACRAGTTGRYCCGDSGDGLGEYAWYSDHSIHPVGQKRPNAFGLCDMHGNVSEWCMDWYDSGYYTRSPVDDPPGSPSGESIRTLDFDLGPSRVLRGGSYDGGSFSLRSADRLRLSQDDRGKNTGFRVIRTP
jgi:formylglycine-generating enzyme required for sulfatase activity